MKSTRVYSYGVDIRRMSKEDLKIIKDQVWLGHRYYNKLVEIEQKHRTQYRALRSSLSPVLKTLTDEVDALEAKYDAAAKRMQTLPDPENPEVCLAKERRGSSPEAKAIEKDLKAIREKKAALWSKISEETKAVEEKHFKGPAQDFERLKILTYLRKAIESKPGLASMLTKPKNQTDEEYYASIKETLKACNLPGPRSREPLKAELWQNIIQDPKQPRAWRENIKLDLWADQAKKEARALSKCVTGVYQKVDNATKDSFEKSMKSGRSPKFASFDHRGNVCAQLPNAPNKVTDAFEERGKVHIQYLSVPVRGCRAISRFIQARPNASPAQIVAEAKAQKIGLSVKWPDRRPLTEAVVKWVRFNSAVHEELHEPQAAVAKIQLAKGIIINVPFMMHRDLPEDGTICWVNVVVKKIGTRDVLELQFTVKSELKKERKTHVSGVAVPLEPSGAIAVNLGWRVLPNNDVLVATAWDGTNIERVTLPSTMRDKVECAGRWLGHAEMHFTTARKNLTQWIKSAKLSEELKPRLENAHAWRNHGKLAGAAYALGREYLTNVDEKGLWRTWREQQTKKGKPTAQAKRVDKHACDLFADFTTLTDWFKAQGISSKNQLMALYLKWWVRKDSHLINSARNIQENVRRNRHEIYRRASALWAAKYKSGVGANWDKSKTAKKPAVEDDKCSPQEDNSRAVRQLCGVSVLEISMKNSFGPRFSKEDASDTTLTHFGCGGKASKAAKSQQVTCTKCGQGFDQDLNAALHLWQRHCESLSGGQTPLGARKTKTPKKSTKSSVDTAN
jgi:hypothetical protein